MLRICLTLFALFLSVDAHVQLLYPPATLNLDFLDTFRTNGICGHDASGSEQTEEWRLPEPNTKTVTEFKAGENVTVYWALHYAHQGGWLFELYDADSQMTSTWNNSDHWDCVSDSTQQSATLKMPETPCKGCVLRLRRQALEWGSGYRFHSCALVDIVDDAADCNGCSGHGKCDKKGKCECDSSPKDGFWYGEYCQSQNECEEDEHCGEGGVCVDTGNITPPNKQCYCREGWFGKETKPLKGSYITSRNCNKRSKLKMGEPDDWEDEYPVMYASVPEGNFKLFFKIDEEANEIEFAIKAKTSNWAAFGFRPIATGLGNDHAMGSEIAEEYDTLLDVDAETEGEGEGDKDTASEGEDDEDKDTASEEDEDEKDTASEGEEDDESSRRRSLKVHRRMPEIQQEAKNIDHRMLQQKSDDEDSTTEGEGEGDEKEDSKAEGEGDEKEDSKAEGEGDEKEDSKAEGEGDEKEDSKAEGEGDEKEDSKAEGEGDSESEGEGEGDSESEGEGDGASGVCEDGKPFTAEYDEGTHDLVKRPKGKRGLKAEMPSLLMEKTEDRLSSRSLKQKDAESDAEGEGDEKEDSKAEGEGDEKEDSKAEGEGDEKEDSKAEGEGDSESEGEGEGDSESEGEGKSDKDKEFIPEIIAKGTECENVATTPAAHAMINQDIYVVYTKDGMFRIQDSFTPSRAKPLPDVFYGGDDGITDALGAEFDDHTYLKFRRKLETVDANSDYCILKDVDYLLVYAYGQERKKYTHVPNSGLETGRVSNAKFYGEDELKFHGGGIGTTYEGRGIFGRVNFFDIPDDAPEGECVKSTLDGYDCMSEALGGEYLLHWIVEDDGVSFACQTTGTGWVALGWPESPGLMIGSEAVIGLGGDEGSVSTYKLEEKSADAIVEDGDLFEIEDGEIEQDDDGSILRFKRIFDDDFDGEGEIDLVVAFHADSNEIEYHLTNRGGIKVTLIP